MVWYNYRKPGHIWFNNRVWPFRVTGYKVNIKLKNATCTTRIHNKFLKTFSNCKIYLNTSFRQPVCSLRLQSKASFTIRERFQIMC